MICPICQTEDSGLSTCSNTYGRRVQLQCHACYSIFLLDLQSMSRENVEEARGEYWDNPDPELSGKLDSHFWTPEDYYNRKRSYGNEGDKE